MTASGVAAAGLAIVIALASLAWWWSVRIRDASIADICWGPLFAVLAWVYCALCRSDRPRPLLVASLITLWGARLSWHIFRRHRGAGEDRRYAAMRAGHGDAFWWRSLFLVFWLQGVLIWVVSLPVLATAGGVEGESTGAIDIAGSVLFVVGLGMEIVADHQLRHFKASPENRGKVLDTGLWRYTRHPNYFGDALLWWGIYLLAPSTTAGRLTVVGPALMTFLLVRVSGVTLLERDLCESKAGYRAYVERTSSFVPWFPRGR